MLEKCQQRIVAEFRSRYIDITTVLLGITHIQPNQCAISFIVLGVDYRPLPQNHDYDNYSLSLATIENAN